MAEGSNSRIEAESRRPVAEDEAARLECRRQILEWMAAREAARVQKIEADHEAERTLKRSGSSSMMQSRYRLVKDEDTRVRNLDGLEPVPPQDVDHLMRMPDIDIPVDERPDMPVEMTCELMPHQKVALKWLKVQEKGKDKCGGLLAGMLTPRIHLLYHCF